MRKACEKCEKGHALEVALHDCPVQVLCRSASEVVVVSDEYPTSLPLSGCGSLLGLVHCFRVRSCCFTFSLHGLKLPDAA